MDASAAQRRRGRRARSSTSQENLIKDSSSDVSPRESSAPVVTDQRHQRRVQRLPTDQQYDNQAFDADERPSARSIERVTEDDEEEENVQNAERLAKHVTKQHRRIVNEVQQKSKQPRKPATSDDTVDDDQEALNEQIKEKQKILSKRVGDVDDRHVLPVEPLPSTIGTGPDQSYANIIEKATQARRGQLTDADMMSTMGSSRRFGASSELKLQRALGKIDTNIDSTLYSTSNTEPKRSTRFDIEDIQEQRLRDEVDRKRKDRINRRNETMGSKDAEPSMNEKDDFFLKVWTKEEIDVPVPPTESTTVVPVPLTEPTTVMPVTTADNIVGGKTKAPGEEELDDGEASAHDENLPEEKQPLLRLFGDIQPAQYQRAEREFDEDEQRDFEEKKYKYVVGQSLGLREKFGDEAIQAHSLEDEGIFVGKKPIVPAKLVRRAEKRVYEECVKNNTPAERWFGPDGALVALPDPTKFVPTRPLIDDLLGSALGKEFHKAYRIDNKHGVSNDPIGSDPYRLDIDLGKITFIHHHYMSIEHVLAMRLKQMHEHYIVRRQQRIVQQLSDKIKALKSAENNCRTLYEQNKYSETNVPKELQERLNNYRNELRQARNERCNEMRLDRQLLKKLLKTWDQIKEIRRTNSYSTTSVKLIIKQTSGKKTKHYEHMKQQIEEEIADEIALAEEQYQREKEAHTQIVRRRKLQDTRKKEAQKRFNKKADADKNTDNPDNEYDQNDIAIIKQEQIYVPDKPEAPKPDEIRTTILTKYEEALRSPDEPEFFIELAFSEPISTDVECSARERARRYHLQTSTDIIARISINGKVITDTPAVPLTGDFEVNFGQIYPCYVFRTPETIKIEFYESSTRFRSPLAELYLPVPESTVTSENYQLQKYEFSSDVLREFSANQTTAVGAGIPSPLKTNSDINYLSIEGILNAGIAWGVQDDVVLVPPDYATSKAYLSRQMGGGNQQDISMQAINLNNMKSLIEWIKQSNLDPYDPENAFLINIMKDYMISRADTTLEINSLQHFRLSIDQDDEMDQDQEHMNIDDSLRFKLLQARNEKLLDFKDFKYVPPYDYLVQKKYGVFKRFMARQQDAADGVGLENPFQGKRQTQIEGARRKGERRLREMREKVLARVALVSTRKTFQEMVVEESIPNIQALRGLLANLYIAPTRPLYPNRRRTEQKKVANLALAANREVYILVNIIGAMDLPLRSSAVPKDTDISKSVKKNAERVTLVRPYVEIQFQKRTYRTSVVDGPNPSWNEELRIPFR